MKFFRLDLLTLLISLFILNGCKNENTLGLAVDPSKQLSGSMIDTATVITTTVPVDSVLTTGIAKTPLAYFKDPVFGTTEANIATVLNLPGNVAYSLPTGTVTIDSALLVMRYQSSFYGDSLTSTYTANVYQLAAKPSSSTTYYSNHNTANPNDNLFKPDPSGSLIGSKTFNCRPNTVLKIYDIVKGAKDTLKKVPAQLRIPISKNFITSNLFGASTTTLSSNTIFTNQVKGLFITLDKNKTTGVGGNMYFNIDSSHVDVYIRANNAGTIDTSIVSLPLSNHSAQILHTYSTDITNALANSTSQPNTTQETVYFQGLGGLRVKVSFPYLKNIIKSLGSDVVLNRAELVVTAAPGSTIPFVPQPKLSLYRYDIAHVRTEVPDAMGGTGATFVDPRFVSVGAFGGYYNNTQQAYHFIVTGYIEDLLRGKTVDYGTYIEPVDTTNISTVDYNATAETAARTVAIGGVTNKNSPNYQYRMRLNIIYTKINQ